MIFKFIYKLILIKYVELFNKSDLILYTTDILLHPTVYVTYHFSPTKKIKSKFRFLIANGLFGLKGNHTIFYLDAEPEAAMDRICRRGSPRQPHENVGELGRLRNEFDDMVGIALKYGFEIFRIDTNVKDLEAVVEEVQSIVEDKIKRLN